MATKKKKLGTDWQTKLSMAADLVTLVPVAGAAILGLWRIGQTPAGMSGILLAVLLLVAYRTFR